MLLLTFFLSIRKNLFGNNWCEENSKQTITRKQYNHNNQRTLGEGNLYTGGRG